MIIYIYKAVIQWRHQDYPACVVKGDDVPHHSASVDSRTPGKFQSVIVSVLRVPSRGPIYSPGAESIDDTPKASCALFPTTIYLRSSSPTSSCCSSGRIFLKLAIETFIFIKNSILNCYIDCADKSTRGAVAELRLHGLVF